MIDLLQGLTLESGAALMAVASALPSLVWSKLRSSLFGWLLALFAPLCLAFTLYWSPMWLGASAVELGDWAALFIVPWFGAGAIASLLVMGALTWSRHRRHRSSQSV